MCVALLPTFFQVMGYGELYLYGIWDTWVKLLGYMSEAVHQSPGTSRGALAIPSCSQPRGKLKDHLVDTLTQTRHTGVEACLLVSPVERTYTYMSGSELRRVGVVRYR